MSNQLIDADERQAIRTRLDSELFVEAGAGTGKTSELTRRVVALISTGRVLSSQVAVITFTEAAAAELRERVRAALEVRVQTESDHSAAERCRTALVSIDEMAIETIHAFARRLLQLHANEAGLPPVFRQVESSEAQIVWRRRWHALVTSTLTSRHDIDPDLDHLLRTGITLGLTVRQLSTVARRFHDRWDRVSHVPVKPVRALELDSLVAALDEALALRNHCPDADDKMAVQLDGKITAWRSQLVAAKKSDNFQRQLGLLVGGPKVNVKSGQKPNWNGRIGEVRDALTAATHERAQLLEAPRSYVMAGLTNLLVDFTVDGVEARRTAGVLEFHDLLVLARNALRDRARVREAVQQHFRCLLVDEFQDTDPLQAEIVELISGGESNVLFTVGDPRQSIYRFRGADVAQYESMRARSSTGVQELRTNFRTAPAVVAWIEEVTAKLRGVHGENLRAPLSPGRSGLEGSVRLLGSQRDDGLNSAGLREIEAADVAASIKEAIDQGWVVDAGATSRAVRYSDVAVLIPTRTALPATERALRDAGVPFRIESRSLIWATQEIRDVLATLGAIDDPASPITIVAALRSVVFGCGDDDLLTWVQGGGSWDYRTPIPEALQNHVVAKAFAWLSSRHDQRWWHSVPNIVDDVISGRYLFEMAFAQPRQRETWHRLRYLVDQAARWVENGGTTLTSFVGWARSQAEHGADARESVIAEADDEAVRIMTIHAAKGLEFPVVVVTGINSVRQITDSARVIWTDDGNEMRLGPQTAGWQSDEFDDAAQADKEADAEEGDRLLYVALTRVRDHLIVSLHHLKKNAACLAARLAEAADGVSVPEQRELMGTSPTQALAQGFTAGGINERMELRARVIASASKPASMSATGINKMVEGEPTVSTVVGDVEVNRQERMAFGRAVHWVLEHVDLSEGSDIAELIDAAVAEEPSVAERREEMERSVRLALDSRHVRAAVESGRYWRELIGGAQHGELALEGLMDLVYESDRGFVIVDYKTDEITTPAASAELARHYKWQLLTYQRLVSANLGVEVADVLLLLINPANEAAVEVSLKDVDAQSAELDVQLGALA